MTKILYMSKKINNSYELCSLMPICWWVYCDTILQTKITF